MADYKINLIKTDKVPKPVKRTIPLEIKMFKTNKEPKSITGKDQDKEKKVRAGSVQMAPNPNGKPKVIFNGSKL